MASLIQLAWMWATSGWQWGTRKPGVLPFMGLQRVEEDLTTEQEQQTADGPHRDSFRRTAKGLSHTYTGIPSPPDSPPTQAATCHGPEFPVLDSRSLLVLHVKYSCVSRSIPNSLTIPSPILLPINHKLILSLWVCFCFISSFVSFHFRFHF